MTDTTNLEAALLAENAANNRVRCNEALIKLDWAAGGMRLVNTTATNTPPGSPADGDAYLVGASPTGAWASNANDIAIYTTANLGWVFFTPRTGMRFHDTSTFEALGYHATYGFYPLQDRWSTTEGWTGKFHGGTGSANRVYRKLVSIGAMPNNTTKTTAHSISNLDLDAPIACTGWCGLTTSGFPFPVAFASSRVDVIVNATTVDVSTNANLASYTGWVQLEYRKTS